MANNRKSGCFVSVDRSSAGAPRIYSVEDLGASRTIASFAAVTFVVFLAGSLRLLAQRDEAFERPPISYSTTTPLDPAAKLEPRLQNGEIKLDGSDREIVRQLLRELHVPESSQILVYSKTSFQNDRIDPRHPRAIYFGDDCYVGWVPGGLLEIAGMDPRLGPVFYSFNPHPPDHRLRFDRDNDCLRCHGGGFVRDIPAILARSVFTDTRGQPVLSLGSELVDHTTPMEKRWGGWYVTGQHGEFRHRGNLILSTEVEPGSTDFDGGANRETLSPFFDTSNYLGTHSDIVSLMVFEHQLAVHNALTKANQHCLWMLSYQQGIQKDLKEEVMTEPTYESTRHAFESASQRVLDALLFKDEAALPKTGVQGQPQFQEDFSRKGIRDAAGRSLREFDLKTRIFKYRCSYLIHSASFDQLQPTLRRQVLERLARIVTNASADPRYAYLEAGERKAIQEIVSATIPRLPAAWKSMP